MYKVKQSDLKGQIEYFPIEVVQRMVECQSEQGNKANVGVFQLHEETNGIHGGFDWSMTEEGNGFWNAIIEWNNFSLFFEKYPKKEPLNESKKAIKDIDVMPKFTWDRKRIDMIKDGIKRYIDANKAIPVDWITEYNELVRGKK